MLHQTVCRLLESSAGYETFRSHSVPGAACTRVTSHVHQVEKNDPEHHECSKRRHEALCSTGPSATEILGIHTKHTAVVPQCDDKVGEAESVLQRGVCDVCGER